MNNEQLRLLDISGKNKLPVCRLSTKIKKLDHYFWISIDAKEVLAANGWTCTPLEWTNKMAVLLWQEKKKKSALISSTFELHILTFNEVRFFTFQAFEPLPPPNPQK